jgi:hypothetical protein
MQLNIQHEKYTFALVSVYWQFLYVSQVGIILRKM